MNPFTKLTAVAAPLELDNVDTDKLIPNRFFRKARGNGLQRYLLHDIRFDAGGNERPDFVLNQEPYRKAQILVSGANFGCGSSREAAVYVVLDYGIRTVIAPSFGDIYFGNMLQNGMLPVVLAAENCAALRAQLRANPGAQITVDLEAQSVTGPDGTAYRFEIDAGPRGRLLQGLDDVGLVLQHLPEIEAFEARYRSEYPWRA
ncbi:MAG: 3-isopropylmalate dehydratase small subunit [Burkholderiales bacterium]|nr:3-isopropylmalate dehydratase small subunit [Burkholderiales bacterium]